MPGAQDSIVVVMLAISAAVWWLWIRRWLRFGELWPKTETPIGTPNTAAVVLTVALIWLSFLSVIQPASQPVSPPTVQRVQDHCLEKVLLIVILLPLLTGFRIERLAEFGFALSGARRQIADGLETAHASFLPVLCVLFATSPLRRSDTKNPLLRLMEQDGALPTLGWILLAAVVLAPLAEELMFRVILLGWLKTKTTSVHAIGISSVAFALIHGPLDGVALLPLALLLGYLYDRRQSFLSVVVAHAFFNLWNIALSMAGRTLGG